MPALEIKRNKMIKKNDIIAMRAIAICFKPYLKPEEALIYTNLGRTQFAKKCEDFGIMKNDNGYYSREDLNSMMTGKRITSIISKKFKNL